MRKKPSVHEGLTANPWPRRATFFVLQTSLLDELAGASVQGLVATDPRRGCRVLRLGTTGEDADSTITGKRCAEVAGFNVHANTRARADQERSLTA
jgi:hypothetical protein